MSKVRPLPILAKLFVDAYVHLWSFDSLVAVMYPNDLKKPWQGIRVGVSELINLVVYVRLS